MLYYDVTEKWADEPERDFSAVWDQERVLAAYPEVANLVTTPGFEWVHYVVDLWAVTIKFQAQEADDG